jgi:hypothetical protein
MSNPLDPAFAILPYLRGINTINWWLHGEPIDVFIIYDLIQASDGEVVLRWSDGTLCSPDELNQMGHLSDDYEVIRITDVREFLK